MANPSPTPPSDVPVAQIEHRLSSAEMFVEEHKKKLILALVVIAVLLIAFFVMRHLNRAQTEEAGSALTSATSVEDYRSVIANYDKGAVSGSAQLLLADTLWENEDQDAAYQTLQDFVANRKDHPLYLKGVSDLGLQEHLRGNYETAIQRFEEVAASEGDDFIKDITLLRLGDAHVASGLKAMEEGDTATAEIHFEKARVAYDDLEAKDNPNWTSSALERKERLQHLSTPAAAPGSVETSDAPTAETQEPPAEQPEVPAEQPEVPAEQPEVPAEQPEVLAEQPEVPAEQPEVPAEQPEVPAEQPEVPAEQPEVPAEQPEVPAEQPEVPAEQPEVPAEQPTELPSESEEPSAEEESPENEG